MPTPEEFLPLPFPREAVPLVTHVRSTLVASSILVLRKRGDYDRYAALLPNAVRDEVTQVVAGVWLPLSLVEAHYAACNGLGYGMREFAEMGHDVGDRIHGTILATGVRLAKGAGATPWTVYAQFGRLWERTFRGGAIGVWKIGPKEAHVDVMGHPLVGIPYFQAAQRAVFLGLIRLFCQKAYASDVRGTLGPNSITYRFAWA